jgi:hypothetical protein
MHTRKYKVWCIRKKFFDVSDLKSMFKYSYAFLVFRRERTLPSISHEDTCSTLCDLRCASRMKLRVNVFLHIWHEKGRSPLCTVRCVFRWGRWVNIFLHTSHEKGRSPLCILRRLFRIEFWVKIFLHTSQENGRSPVCTLIWFSRLGRPVKLLIHTLHAKGRARLLNRCTALRLWVNYVTHISQVVVFLLLPLVCPDRLFLQENGFLSHMYGRSLLCITLTILRSVRKEVPRH